MKNVASVYSGEPKQGKADCIITMSDDHFMDLVMGKLNGQQVIKYIETLCYNGEEIKKGLNVIFVKFKML